MSHPDPHDPLPPTVPAAVVDFLTALRALGPAAWRAVLTAARARTPGDPLVLDALTVLSMTTRRLELGAARRAVEARARWAMGPVLARVGRELSFADEATLLFAGEWAATALLVRGELAPAHFDVLYAPFTEVIPPPPLERSAPE